MITQFHAKCVASSIVNIGYPTINLGIDWTAFKPHILTARRHTKLLSEFILRA